MDKHTRPVISLILMATIYVLSATVLSAKEEIVFLTWPDYIDPEVVATFEQTRDVSIRFVYFQSDDERDRLLLDANGLGYDIVLMSGMPISTYVKRGWLSAITEHDVPNLKHISNKWRNAFHDSITHAVPYFWGTVGIAYRADMVSEKITHWKQFFNPPLNLGKKIAMIDSGREAIGMALKALGYSINTTDITQLHQAEELLTQQRDFVNGYTYINITEESSLVSGETVMALAYNGDAMAVKEHEPNIEFVIPEEGSMLWVDYLTVLQSSTKHKLAFDFINYLNDTNVAKQLALYTYYATPHQAAEKELPEDYKNNPIIYPEQQALNNSETEQRLPPRVTKEYGRIMATLTRER